MLVSGSSNSSLTVFSNPNDVFPVPGGPIIKKRSLALFTFNIRSLNSPYSPFNVIVSFACGSLCNSNKSRLSLGAVKKACIPL